MKFITNIVANKEFLGEYCSREKLADFLSQGRLDGYEVICAGEYPNQIDNSTVIGLHLPFYNAWMDLYHKRYDRLKWEYGNEECWRQFYGGDSFDDIYRHLLQQLDFADSRGVQYVVLHVCEIATYDTLTGRFEYTHTEVIDAMCEVINRLFKDKKYNFYLLLENLWWRGFTFTDPQLTKYMLDKVEYKNKGIMLDTGHLMHTNKDLNSWEDATEYIDKMLDMHRDLLPYVKGVHLHGTLEGRFAKEFYEKPIDIKTDFWQRFAQAYEYVERVDAHKPFACEKVRQIIEKINPQFVVYELQEKTMQDKLEAVKLQNKYMNR